MNARSETNAQASGDIFRESADMKAEFDIKGMHCQSCAADIKETLEEMAGVQRADVTFDGQTAIIEFDDATVQQATLVNKIQELGYQATNKNQSQGEIK